MEGWSVGFVRAKPRRRRRGDYKGWERSAAKQLWQLLTTAGKYGPLRPAEVLFDRICRRNGIEHLLTKVQICLAWSASPSCGPTATLSLDPWTT
jgi:hypothetical protein